MRPMDILAIVLLTSAAWILFGISGGFDNLCR